MLIFSKKGQGRCAIVMCLFFMYAYKWEYLKARDFIKSKKLDIYINNCFSAQMLKIEKIIMNFTSDNKFFKNFEPKSILSDELVLVNLIVFLNHF